MSMKDFNSIYGTLSGRIFHENGSIWRKSGKKGEALDLSIGALSKNWTKRCSKPRSSACEYTLSNSSLLGVRFKSLSSCGRTGWYWDMRLRGRLAPNSKNRVVRAFNEFSILPGSIKCLTKTPLPATLGPSSRGKRNPFCLTISTIASMATSG